MKSNYFSSKLKTTAFVIAAVPILFLYSCSGNKGKLQGKWQLKEALVYDPDIDTALSQISAAQDKTYSGSDEGQKLKKMRDSVMAIRNSIQNAFQKSVYQFNGDGTVEIQTPKDPIKGTWDLKKGGDHYMYVEITKDGKLFERWQLDDEAFSIGQYTTNKEMYLKINNGGPFERDAFHIEGTAKKME